MPVFLCFLLGGLLFVGHFGDLPRNEVNMIELGVDNGVVYALSIPGGFHEAGFAQDGQVLGGHGLLDAQLRINIRYDNTAVLVYELQQLLPQGMIDCTEYKCCLFQQAPVDQPIMSSHIQGMV